MQSYSEFLHIRSLAGYMQEHHGISVSDATRRAMFLDDPVARHASIGSFGQQSTFIPGLFDPYIISDYVPLIRCLNMNMPVDHPLSWRIASNSGVSIELVDSKKRNHASVFLARHGFVERYIQGSGSAITPDAYASLQISKAQSDYEARARHYVEGGALTAIAVVCPSSSWEDREDSGIMNLSQVMNADIDPYGPDAMRASVDVAERFITSFVSYRGIAGYRSPDPSRLLKRSKSGKPRRATSKKTKAFAKSKRGANKVEDIW